VININKLIRENKSWTHTDAFQLPDTIFRQLQKNTKYLEQLKKRDKIMKNILSYLLILLVPVLCISVAKADSVTVSYDKIEYEGYQLSGQSLSFNQDMGKYGYELSIQRTDAFNINEQYGSLNVNNKLDITNVSVGLYRKLFYKDFYIRPIVGAVHTTANVKTTVRYQKDFKALDYSYPVDLRVDIYQTKTVILPLYGFSVGYSVTSNIGVYLGYRKQGYTVKSIGVEVNF
jgi:hypothetical protein